MAGSIFSRIVRGELPSHKVWEDADFFAFLDINPVKPGHTPHVHVHLIPIFKTMDIDPKNHKRASNEELAPIAESIRQQIAKAGI